MLTFKYWMENYNQNILYLKKYLQDRHLDLYNHAYDFLNWPKSSQILRKLNIDRNKLEKDYDEGNSEIFDRIERSLSQEEKEELAQKIAKSYPAEAPTWHYLSVNKNLLRPDTWLIHFSDHAKDIVLNGFKYGVEQVERLGLTTNLSDTEKSWPGYNFAFIANSKEAKFTAKKGKYGKDAVMFQAAGVQAWHYGDEENQVMFYGPTISPTRIVLLRNLPDDGWCIMMNRRSRNRDTAFCGEFSDSVNWVIKNQQQYKNVIMDH